MSEHQRYKLLYKLDAGGMAEIFRAKSVSVSGIEKEVAIKRIMPGLAKRPKFVRMFLDEARLAMELSHANIVQVFDVGRAQDTYFLVMEFVDGYNLRRLMQKVNEVGRRIPVNIACFIAAETLKALAYAHEKKDAKGRLLRIVHRDVSPPNILLSKAGEVKLADFGLAKAVTQAELTDPGIVKGKFAYLCPEAINGKPVDHRADLFAMGIVLWEMLANHRLFLGVDEQETLDMVKAARYIPLKPYNQEADDQLDAILKKALAKDPKKRFATAKQFGDAISDYLFKHKIKVTSYDLANFLTSVFEGEPEDDATSIHAIGNLIQDEILSLSMVKYAGKPLPIEGEDPIKLEEISYSGKDTIDEEEIFGEGFLGKEDLSDMGSEQDSTASEADKTEDSKSQEIAPAAAAAKKGGHPWLWVLLFFLLVTVFGVGAWYLWEHVL